MSLVEWLRGKTGVDNTSSQKTRAEGKQMIKLPIMHQLRYKIGKRAKLKRAEVEARQRETRRSGSAPKRNAPNWNRVKMEVAKVKRAKLTRVKAERANVEWHQPG